MYYLFVVHERYELVRVVRRSITLIVIFAGGGVSRDERFAGMRFLTRL